MNQSNSSSFSALLALANAPLLIIASIALGSFIGYNNIISDQWINATTDPTIFVLVTLLIFSVGFNQIAKASTHFKFLAIALIANFIFIPLIGFSIASLILPNAPLFMVGLMIYFMSPCTDWFLAFTRIANGNTLIGATLIPLQMALQLLLYPLFLYLFTDQFVEIQQQFFSDTLIQWFIKPLLIALGLRYVLYQLLSKKKFDQIISLANQAIPFVISLLVIQIFAVNFTTLLAHKNMFGLMLLGVFSFFILTSLLSELTSKRFKLSYPEHALLTMTTAARNAPLMLAVTMVLLPDQPIVYASIVVGMLLEFPHLALLTFLLRLKQANTFKA